MGFNSGFKGLNVYCMMMMMMMMTPMMIVNFFFLRTDYSFVANYKVVVTHKQL
jgi:hypothetical protein